MRIHSITTIICKLFCALAFLLIPSYGFADDNVSITGKVLENPMRTPLPYATVKALNPKDSSIVAIATSNGVVYHKNVPEYTGAFSMNLPRGHKYILRFSSTGMKTVFSDIDLSKIGKREYSMQIPDVALSPESKTLGEVTVRASKVKFYHRGDTLVYNADAFALAEGSMLDALIQQLPNVELRDNGEIYVNGKYVESLLLNGKSFFNDKRQLMLENLGAYTVKNVEVYDQRGLRGQLADKDVGDSKLVMDVKLKKEYMVGVNFNLEAGYGTHDRYLGRLFGMGFSPTAQYSFYFNANNLNDSRKPGQSSNWTPETMPTGVRKTISGGFDYNISPKGKRWTFNGSAEVGSSREKDGTDVVRENYLSGGNTFEYLFNRSRNRDFSVSTNHTAQYVKTRKYSLKFSPYFNYNNWNRYSEDIDAVFSREYNDITTSFINDIYSGNNAEALGALINRNIQRDRRKGHSLSTGLNAQGGISMPGSEDQIIIDLNGNYVNMHDERFNTYSLNFGDNPVPAQSANRYFHNYPDFNSSVSAQIGYLWNFTQRASLTFSYGYQHDYRRQTSDLYNFADTETPDNFMSGALPSVINYEASIDRSNSFLRRESNNRHKFTLEFWSFIPGKFSIYYKVPLYLDIQHLDYMRGGVNSTLSRKSFLVDIGNAYMTIGDRDAHYLWFNFDLKSQRPDMVAMVDYTDTTDPLFIRKGNPGLKNALVFRGDMNYTYWLDTKKRNLLSPLIEYGITANALSYGYIYDSATGIRTGSYHNVNGNWYIDGGLEYSYNYKGLRIYNQFKGGTRTSADLVGYDSPVLKVNKVYNRFFTDLFIFNYQFRGGNRVYVLFNGENNRFTSKLPDFTTQNTWTLKTTVGLLYNLPANFEISTDFSIFNRRGYTDSALNTDNFVWNARLTYKAFKGKLLLMLDGYDILHDLKNVSYTMNAQGRTETIRTVLPRYFMLHLQWRFNHTPKPKKAVRRK